MGVCCRCIVEVDLYLIDISLKSAAIAALFRFEGRDNHAIFAVLNIKFMT